ncbi:MULTISPECIES: diadenylate cyclase CdaA [Geobacter]|uniref:diadenylate cyclase CdaA n=1 Tax=Geobacter TaxID=28231 RepID=UPI0025743364|nr:diadenylate cyclase CdaA [Geobacter sulfurreducens]BEH11131.1 diadenylate cyclase CdaA [Geobacter sulfurreducens subsp. ethanolicus]BET58980.1 diadenylate cyclase CdaA [Geobacter sp. 60473]HML79190.1 diadenylate cyclase CdaA [Geobacter sulfurreducens]
MFHLIRWQDIADIIIMSFLAYRLYSWFRHTRAMQVLIGLGILAGVYFVTRNLGLFMTSWILQELGTVLFVLIIVVFQAEIRQALYRFSLLRTFIGRQEGGGELDLAELGRTVFGLALERTGALIVLQRQEALDDYLLHGVKVDGLPSSHLLGSIFRNGTPLHDGAVVIKDGRVSQASCHLPLSMKTELPQNFGTRHRAGIGLSERSDAVVIIVSEERGDVGMALAGEYRKIASPEEFAEVIRGLLYPQRPENVAFTLRQRLMRNLVPKIVTTLIVIAGWLVVTTKEGGIFTVTVPIKFHNLPPRSVLVKSVPESVEVQLKVFTSLIPSPKQLDLVADLNLASVHDGVNSLAVKDDDLNLPLGVVVTGINPPVVKVTIAGKERKQLRVRPKLTGQLPGRAKLRSVTADPDTVVVEGPGHLLEGLESLPTETVDLAGLRRGGVVERRVVSPSPQIRVLRDEPVRVNVITSAK